jgi:hypothetical protein
MPLAIRSRTGCDQDGSVNEEGTRTASWKWTKPSHSFSCLLSFPFLSPNLSSLFIVIHLSIPRGFASPSIIIMPAHRRRRARRSSARRSTAIKWLDVQPELRNMILEAVISASFTSTDEEPVRLAPLASVCKEWQAFFEHHIFRRLVIGNEDLEVFSKALAPPDEIRIKYIKHIQLRVTLAPYECPDCRKSESRETRAAFVNHHPFPLEISKSSPSSVVR